jgi:ATP-dependent helicase/nuclease subunit A
MGAVSDVLELTDAQWDAVRETERHVLVAAGAGTGKTRTVVARVLYLLGVPFRGHTVERPLALRDIAAITYTNAAAADLKRRLREGLRAAGRDTDAYDVDGARIGTIHAFCGDILKEFALRSGHSAAARVLTEGEGAALVATAVSEALLDAMEAGAVPGLRELLGEVAVDDVERWVAQLLEESDRLRDYRRVIDTLGARERTLVALAAYTLPRLDARLRGRGTVDFDRMIVWTRDLLTEHPAVRRMLQRRIRTLIVDEFQDVDPVQLRIADLLGEPVAKRHDTTRLMLVGDPKQSIFRFRRADVTGWHDVERNFADRKLGAVVSLVQNFRSAPPVLGFVDATIGQLLDTAAPGTERQDYEVAYQPLEATRPADGAPAVEILRVPARPDGRDYGTHDVRVMEAAAAAQRARQLHDGGVRWGDMAVLVHGWGDLATYQAAFERVGAPTYALRAEGFWIRREVVDMVLALEAVRDPGDDRALLGFLRSPFVGLKDESLLAIARQTRRPYWDHRAALDVAEQSLLQRGLAVLERHTLLRDRMPTADLLEELLFETGYLAHLALLGEPGRQAIANVRKFVAMARAAPEASVGAFLRVVNEARRVPVREPDALLHGPEDDVVTITSVHSAKGLEWRVVFWCDLVRGGPRRPDHMLLAHERLMVRDPAWKRHDEPPEWKALRDAIGAEEEAEDKRVWYVALTRAQDRLIVGGVPVSGGRPKTAAAALRAALPELAAEGRDAIAYRGHTGALFTAEVRPADPAALALPPAAPLLEPDPAAGLVEPVVPLVVAAGRLRHSATEHLTYARCPTRHWFKYVAMIREPPVNREGPEFLDAVTRGIIVHDVLEHYEEEADLDRLLDEAIRRLPEDAPMPDGFEGQRQRALLREEIQRVARHPDYRAIDDLPSKRRELAFLHLGAGGEHTEGRFDLAALEDAGLVLLDVKTGQGGEAQVRRRATQYRPQRDVYVAAAEAIGGQDVARFAFQFSRAGVQVSEPVTAAARRQAADELPRALRGMQSGAPELTSHPHECRFCGYRRDGWCSGVPLRREGHQLSLGL